MKHKFYQRALLLIVVLVLSLTAGCGASNPASDTSGTDTLLTDEAPKARSQQVSDEATEGATVHFLDVGQGLSIFVQSGGQNLIYDGGDRDTSSFVVSYLKSQGVTKINYLISSHYDADHLAGLVGCLNAFEVDTVIGANYEYDSKIYTSFMNTISEKGLTVQHPEVGSKFNFGTGTFEVLAPIAISNDNNANSVVIKLVNGNNRFLFTGDADHKSEAQMCEAGLDLDCDVLTIGHHGSATCTSYDFLEATLPETAVISAGAGNQYRHPAKDTMEKLEDMEIDVFRTDKQGTIIAVSDGSEITWNLSPSNDYSPGDKEDAGTQPAIKSAKTTASDSDSEADDMVWKSKTGKKFHRIPDCGTMNPDEAIEIPRSEAALQGLEICSKCF